jgi:hypothetical protein
MKTSIFWDITLCIPLKVSQRFGGVCRSKKELWLRPASYWFLAWLTLQPWRWYDIYCSVTFVDLQRAIRHYIQETELSIITSLRISSPSGRTIAQAVSRRLPTAAARVQTRVWSRGILWWTKVVLGQVFSENFGFPCQSTFHLLLHSHFHYHPRLAQ